MLQVHFHLHIKPGPGIIRDFIVFHSNCQVGIEEHPAIGPLPVQNPLERLFAGFQPLKQRKVIACGLRPAIGKRIGNLGKQQFKRHIRQASGFQNVDFFPIDQGHSFVLVIDLHRYFGRGDGHKHTTQIHFVCHYSCTPSSETSNFSAKSLAQASMIPSRSVSLEMWFSLCCSTWISAVVNRLIASRSAISRK